MQNIGERLEEARKRKGISIREAAEATKIRGDYLHKFESNQFDINLPDIYVRGFLRTYANYLKLPADKIVADYNGLGLGDVKSRSLNREVYGRMDLSVASAREAAREPEPTSGGPSPGDEAKPETKAQRERANPATFVPRGRTLYVDKALLLKGGALVLGVVVAVLLIVWGINAFTGRSNERPSAAAPGNDQRLIVIHALDAVTVQLVQESDGTVLYDGPLARNEQRSFPKRGTLMLTASALENVEVEMYGNRYPTGQRGRGRVKIE
jgi:cytoskeleton protein RodZ